MFRRPIVLDSSSVELKYHRDIGKTQETSKYRESDWFSIGPPQSIGYWIIDVLHDAERK